MRFGFLCFAGCLVVFLLRVGWIVAVRFIVIMLGRTWPWTDGRTNGRSLSFTAFGWLVDAVALCLILKRSLGEQAVWFGCV